MQENRIGQLDTGRHKHRRPVKAMEFENVFSH